MRITPIAINEIPETIQVLRYVNYINKLSSVPFLHFSFSSYE